MRQAKRSVLLSVLAFLMVIQAVAQTSLRAGDTMNKQTTGERHGTLITEKLTSVILRDNLISIDPNRSIKIYLPPGYASSSTSYPVVYYCHNTFWTNEKLFGDGRLVNLMEQGFSKGVVKEFILVVADYSTSTMGSIYENSTTSGRWLDFTVNELVPFIDSKFRTLRHRNSRAVTGDFFGGTGALKLAMMHAEIFSVVYALHPVGTGTGDIPWPYINIDWKVIHQAKSFADIADGRARLFLRFCQAYLPNPNRPPFYCDFVMEMEKNGEPKLSVENSKKLRAAFLLDQGLNESDKNLRTMRGIAFDWGRFDETRAHVSSNRDFSTKLQDLGIEHEAEEYSGNPWDKTWIDNGRFYSRVLPFFDRHLVFEAIN